MEATGPTLELGSSFRSYEDFRQCFRAYELAEGYRYGLRSCVSVCNYNRQYGTAVRQDIVFMQVKFGCSWTQTCSMKKKKEFIWCPAYFELQYKEDIDRLVISDLNSNHAHSEPVLYLIRAAAAAATANAAACHGPAAKLHEEQQQGGTNSVAVADKDMQVVAGQPVVQSGHPNKAPMIPAAAKEKASVLVRVAEVMKTFLRADRGALASVSTDSSHSLDRLSFQTSKMSSLFMQFPKSLLLHRVLGEDGRLLYAFIAESKERVGKVVHLSLLKEDIGYRFRKMLTIFKEFNPEWRKVQVIFVDVSFFHTAILKAFFPSAQVLPSVYHTVQLLKKNVKEATTSSSFKQKLMLALRKAVFAPSAANRDALSQLAKNVVSPEVYNYLQANWFSCELLWRMHAEKGLQFCSMHMASLDLITLRLSNLFSQQPSLGEGILPLMHCADCLDSKGWESPSWGFLSTEAAQSGLSEKPNACTGAAAEPGPVSGSPTPAEPTREAAVADPGSRFWENCMALGCWLCPQEWEVALRSARLLSLVPGGLTIWLLEDTHRVSRDCRTCTCGFHCRYRLPCRHVLAMLQAHRSPVEESMVDRRWQRRYQHLPVPSAADPPGCSGGLVGGQPEGREERIQSLCLELVNLLMQCDGEELEERCSALKAVLAAWTPSPEEAAGKVPVFPRFSW